MEELNISEVKFDYETLHPYVDIEFKTKLALDREGWAILKQYGETIFNVMACHFRDVLESSEKLQELLKEKQRPPLKEYWCKEKLDFCRGTDAQQELDLAKAQVIEDLRIQITSQNPSLLGLGEPESESCKNKSG